MSEVGDEVTEQHRSKVVAATNEDLVNLCGFYSRGWDGRVCGGARHQVIIKEMLRRGLITFEKAALLRMGISDE